MRLRSLSDLKISLAKGRSNGVHWLLMSSVLGSWIHLVLRLGARWPASRDPINLRWPPLVWQGPASLREPLIGPKGSLASLSGPYFRLSVPEEPFFELEGPSATRGPTVRPSERTLYQSESASLGLKDPRMAWKGLLSVLGDPLLAFKCPLLTQEGPPST